MLVASVDVTALWRWLAGTGRARAVRKVAQQREVLNLETVRTALDDFARFVGREWILRYKHRSLGDDLKASLATESAGSAPALLRNIAERVRDRSGNRRDLLGAVRRTRARRLVRAGTPIIFTKSFHHNPPLKT